MCKKTNYKNTSNTQIDKCIRPLIKWLDSYGFITVASCCGHNRYPMTVIIKYTNASGGNSFRELLSGTVIPRTRNFYKKDSKGFYYIPEVSK